MSTPLRALAASLAGAVVLPAALVATAPAHAETQSPKDRRADVVKVNHSSESPKRKPRNRIHDLVGASASYGDRRLRLSATVRKLAGDDTTLLWDVRTSRGLRAWVRYTDGAGRPSVELTGPSGGEGPPCHRLRFDRRAAQERVVVTLPRSCVDGARWITFGVLAGTGTPHGTLLDDVRRFRRASFSRAEQGGKLRYG